MQFTTRFISLAIAVVLLGTGIVVAQDKMMKMSGVTGSYMKLAMQAEEQIVSLANAVPEDKYSWRPMEGVRSMSESFVHAASGNYLVLQMIGGTLPEGLDIMKIEKTIVKKDAAVKEIKRSFNMLHMQIMKLSDKDLATEVDFFGTPMTKGDLVVFAVAHQRETLGQEIAYARMNGVVPPWTAAQQAAARSEMK